jgi:hypothetical protein
VKSLVLPLFCFFEETSARRSFCSMSCLVPSLGLSLAALFGRSLTDLTKLTLCSLSRTQNTEHPKIRMYFSLLLICTLASGVDRFFGAPGENKMAAPNSVCKLVNNHNSCLN